MSERFTPSINLMSAKGKSINFKRRIIAKSANTDWSKRRYRPSDRLMAESNLVHSKNESFYWQSRKIRNFANFSNFSEKIWG
jgi:hypothetical protein